MELQLNKYKIEDFLKLKPIIYEYCVNLTVSKTATSWFRDFHKADDLYQDVALHLQKYYFSKDREPISDEKFTQLMKNTVYIVFVSNLRKKSNKVTKYQNYYETSTKDYALFEDIHSEQPSIFADITENPDYQYYTSKLNVKEKKAINLCLSGYNKTEIAKELGEKFAYLDRVITKLQSFNIQRTKVKSSPIVDHKAFLESKISNFEEVFRGNRKWVMEYSLYLQGVSQKVIAKRAKKPRGQVCQDIYRINKKVIKYGN